MLTSTQKMNFWIWTAIYRGYDTSYQIHKQEVSTILQYSSDEELLLNTISALLTHKSPLPP